MSWAVRPDGGAALRRAAAGDAAHDAADGVAERASESAMLTFNPHELSRLARISVVCGFNLDTLLNRLDTRGYQATDTDEHWDLTTMARLFDIAMASSSRAYFPFAVGEDFVFDRAPELDAYLASCASLRQVLAVLDYLPFVLHPELIAGHELDGVHATLHFEFRSGTQHFDIPGYVEAIGVATTRMIEKMLQQPVDFSIRFRHQPLQPLDAYVRQFHTSPQFGAADNAVVLPQHYIDRPLKNHSPSLQAKSQLLLESRLKRMQAHAGLGRTVAIMLNQDPSLSMPALCARLEIEPRSLQRRLKQAGTSFNALQSRARYERAVSLLVDRGMDLNSIAIKLGFADRNTFTKAFIKWAGVPPSHFRREALK